MSEQGTPRRRRSQQPKLPGNNPYWIVGVEGFASWKPVALTALFEEAEEFEGEVGYLLSEYEYLLDETLSREQTAFGGLTILVYVAADTAAYLNEAPDKYPYVIRLVFGEYEEHTLFCPSFPACLATLAGLGPIVMALRPSVDDDDRAEEHAERQALEHELMHELMHERLVQAILEGEENDRLIEGLELSPMAIAVTRHTIMSGNYRQATLLCDHIATLLPYDGHVGRAEVSLLRGNLAEVQHDLDTAASHYYGALHEVGDTILAPEDEDSPRITALMDLARVERQRKRYEEAHEVLHRADLLISRHDEQPHPCHLRTDWCIASGELEASCWRAGEGEGCYEQALAHYERAVELAGANRLIPQKKHAEEQLWLLRHAREARG